MAHKRTIALVALVLCSFAARGEVVDKMATIPELWTHSLVIATALAVVGFFAPRSVLGMVIAAAVSLAFVWPPAVEPEFLPDALEHFGPSYGFHAQASVLLVPIGAGIGYIFGWWRKRRKNAI
jgi:hypothetical protein